MAIAQDSISAIISANTGSFNFSHTCSGNNRILIVVLTARGGASDTISGVTYNGVSMTRVKAKDHTASTEWIYIYALLNPATGTNSISVTKTATNVSYYGAVSYTGVNTGQTLTAITGESTSNSISLTSTVDNSAMFVWVQNSTDIPTASTGSTYIDDLNGTLLLQSNPLAITPAGSKTMNYTGTDNNSIGFIFEPSAPITISINDTVTTSENIEVPRSRVTTTTDTVTTSESASASRAYLINILDTIVTSETVSIVRTIVSTIIDTITTSEPVIILKKKFTNVTKSTTATFANVSKNVASWTNRTKN